MAELRQNTENNTITITGTLSTDENGFDSIQSVAIDNQNTFICVNDPSETAMLTAISNIILNDPIDVSLVPHINIKKDLLYIFINIKNTKYYKYDNVLEKWVLVGVSDNSQEAEKEDFSNWDKEKTYHINTYSTKLAVTYDNVTFINNMWEIIKTFPKSICCDDFPTNIKNILIYKEGISLALQLKEFKKANIFWNKAFSKNSNNILNCSCNG